MYIANCVSGARQCAVACLVQTADASSSATRTLPHTGHREQRRRCQRHSRTRPLPSLGPSAPPQYDAQRRWRSSSLLLTAPAAAS